MIDRGAELHEDTTTARAAYLVEGDQWIAFDTPNTIAAKIAAARKLGLGGLMVSLMQCSAAQSGVAFTSAIVAFMLEIASSTAAIRLANESNEFSD